MQPDQLHAIAAQAAETLTLAIQDESTAIIRAIAEAYEQAEADHAEGVSFDIKYAIKLNLTKRTQTNRLSWGTARSHAVACRLPDPDQPDLPLGS
jgi:hypothetical protein